ncbi:type I-E CRISPR-associated protein Cse1/CasA [Nocardiopsis gilva]|uniref:type I-E CRISPR-associated protein Cse1/CasA n=1 Tax=Nocardiopsis gilva TaxID=280236 RepID=UPI00034ABDF8|nr:type I-E CRISPR-associated protein Cse1/CasA [Nocardiopsis gilva]
MSDDHFSFNLVDQVWLPYVDTGGGTGTASLRQVLIDSPAIKDLTVDTPTQYPAILRVLLAVLHRSMGTAHGKHHGSYPRDKRGWKKHYASGPPATQINEYLDTWRDRFDLFGIEAPFLQVSDLRSTNGDRKPSSLLIPYAAAGNNAPIFSAHRDASPEALTPAQATRWLIHAHAWDTAGIKTGAARDTRAKNGKTTGNRTGLLGNLGVIVPTGDNLWETLMFNLLVLDDALSPRHDVPVWEHDSPLTANWQERSSRGLLDLYTWPGRRIRLFPEQVDGEVRVREVLVCAGDRLRTDEPLHGKEPHTAWYSTAKKAQSATSSAKAPLLPYRPITHEPGQQLWRGLGGILGRGRDGTQRDQGLPLPKALEQVGIFQRAIGRKLVRVHASGIAYGLQNAVIDETYADVLPLPVALFEVEGEQELAKLAIAAVTDTGNAAWALGRLAADIAFASGADEDTQKAREPQAKNRLYAALDQPFRAWVAGLQDESRIEDYRADWHRTARQAAWKIASDLIGQAPPSAMRSRTRKEKPKGQKGEPMPMNLALAEREFSRRLRYRLPSAYPQQDSSPEQLPSDDQNGDAD